MTFSPDTDAIKFDEIFDVVVVGYGFAGGAAAIEAADLGASVLLIEKMPDPGGISICAGGGIRLAWDADEAFEYLKATSNGRTDETVLRTFADEVANLEPYLRGLAAINNAKVTVRDRQGNYPFPGCDAWGFFEIDEVPGFDPRVSYPHVRGRLGGPVVFKVVEDNVNQRGVDVRTNCPAKRLIKGPDGSVLGLTMDDNGTEKSVKARKGVILACGGFEADQKMQEQYWQLQPVVSAVSRGNTGDGIRMAQDAGADLWHMWMFHGSYGFRHPDPNYHTALRMKRLPDWTPQRDPVDVQMAWIVVDKKGKRYMNEYPPYGQDTGHRDMDIFEPQTMSFPRIPSHVIVDENGRKMYPLGQAVINDRTTEPYDWSSDNMKEVENGILKKADTLEQLAEILEVDMKTLTNTLDRWNAQCDAGDDEDFGRPKGTMARIDTPPFYTGKVWPVVSNTQGGPRHDEKWRIVTPFGEPIPRLYEAGDLGSIWGYLYLVGGNLAECFISGRIAARDAVALDAWDAT